MRTRTVILAAIAVLLAVSFLPAADDSSAMESGDISWYIPGETEISANSSETLLLSIYNKGDHTVHVKVTVGDVKDVNISLSESDFELKPHESANEADRKFIDVTLDSDRYSDYGQYQMVFTLTMYDLTAGSESTAEASTVLTVHSKYGDSDPTGRIFGFIDNPFPSGFDAVLTAALITLGLWMIISAVASSLVRIVCDRIIGWASGLSTKKKLIDTKSFKKMWKYVYGIVMMYGLANCMMVLGIDNNIIGRFTNVTDVITVLFVGMVFWHMLTSIANVLSYKFSDGDEESSLKPLFLLIGRAIIIIAVIAILLSIAGLDLGQLILAMGLGATGISFGAKTVITQFFCGVQIMIIRTFRAGDKIKVGADPTTLVVKEIGIMTTRCKNWSNEEIYYVPNSTMSDAKVVNITKENVYYKVYDYYTIDHKADIGLARQTMVSCAYSDEGVVADGSFSKPEVRVEGVNTNEIVLRLSYTVVDHEDYGVISARIRKDIIEKFREEGIDIPYPQYVINVIPDLKDTPKNVTPTE